MSNRNATQVQYKFDTSATRVLHERRERDTSAIRTTLVRHECYANDTSATRVKNFHFDKGTTKNIFSHPYIFYMASERLQEEEQFYSKNYILEMPCSHVKMCSKSPPQKLHFLLTKDLSKIYTLDCSCSLMLLHVPA